MSHRVNSVTTKFTYGEKKGPTQTCKVFDKMKKQGREMALLNLERPEKFL